MRERSFFGAVLLVALATTASLGQEVRPAAPEPEPAKEGQQQAPAPRAQDLAIRTAQVQDELRSALSLQFTQTPLYEAQWFLRDILKTTVLIDAAADPEASVTLSLREVPLEAALGQFAAAAGLELQIWRGFLVMRRPGQPVPALPADGDAERARLATRLVSLQLDEDPVSAAADLLAEITGRPVTFPDEVMELRLCLGVEALPASDLLDALAIMTGCTWRVGAGGALEFVRVKTA